MFGKVADWIREKPLRFYGYSSLATDLFLGMDAYNEYKKDPKKWATYTATALAGLSYSLADMTVAMSSKDHTNDSDGKFTADEQRRLEAIAAEFLAKQPESSRNMFAQRLGTFLAKRKETRGGAASVSQSILEQAKQLQDNPWAERYTSQGDISSAAGR